MIALKHARLLLVHKRVQHRVQRSNSGFAFVCIAIYCEIAGVSALKAVVILVGIDKVPSHSCTCSLEHAVVAKYTGPDDVEAFT